jgi:plasmid maintenance system antidote protein VapI
MTKQLTINEILRKHFDGAPYGSRIACARELDVSQKDFSRWLSGVTTPSGNYAVRLLQYLGELKNYPPSIKDQEQN